MTPDDDTPTVDDAVIIDDSPVVDDAAVIVDEEAGEDVLLADDGVSDEDTFCPSLETVTLPFRDAQNNIHFCRPCDLPAKADDPKCVRNLWDAANKKLATDYPEQDCYPYPCVIEGLKPGAGSLVDPDCDFLATPDKTSSGINIYKHSVLNNGQLAWTMGRISLPQTPENLKYPTSDNMNLLDLAPKKYRAIMPITGMILGYSQGLTVAMVADYNKIKDVESAKASPSFLVAYDEANGYRPVFNDVIADMTMNAFMNDKWFIAHFTTVKGNMATRYAKVGEWNWHFFDGGLEYIATMSGDMLGYFTSSYIGYVCDLSKTPRYASDCIKVNRGNESVDYVTMDRENPKRFVFSPFGETSSPSGTLVIADITDQNTLIYKEVTVTPSEPNFYLAIAHDFRGDLILYGELFESQWSSPYDSKQCFYKISENKSYCPSGWTRYDMGKAEFEGKWMVWQGYIAEGLVIRDLECYCGKYPDSCPPELVAKKVLNGNRKHN